MCVSRLHRVIGSDEPGSVVVADVLGDRHVVSLLALDGPPPHRGEWLVVNSGYAIDRVEPEEAESVLVELQATRPEEPATGGRQAPGEGRSTA